MLLKVGESIPSAERGGLYGGGLSRWWSWCLWWFSRRRRIAILQSSCLCWCLNCELLETPRGLLPTPGLDARESWMYCTGSHQRLRWSALLTQHSDWWACCDLFCRTSAEFETWTSSTTSLSLYVPRPSSSQEWANSALLRVCISFEWSDCLPATCSL